MIRVLSVQQTRAVEAAADAAGLTYDQMMQNAGQAVARTVLNWLGAMEDARVTVLVGPGNNGGDGLVAGRLIAQEGGAQVRFYLLKARPDDDPHLRAVREAGLFVALADHDRDLRVLRNMVASADVVIDALFGIGVRLPLTGEAEKLLRGVNRALNDTQRPVDQVGMVITPTNPFSAIVRPRPYVVAVDCPSGLDCDTGDLDANTIAADETVTFIAAKPGLLTFPGAAAAGELHVASIGMPDDLPELQDTSTFLVDAAQVREWLPGRAADSNKGTFGKVLAVAGSHHYVGAPGLAALAAYRVGAGLVTVSTTRPVAQALYGHLLETTWLPLPDDDGALTAEAASIIRGEVGRYDALLLGPGWGRDEATRDLLAALLERREPQGDHPPLVIDADGLNLLSELDGWPALLPPNTVLTPHPGEMARLTGMDIPAVQADRFNLARQKAAAWKVVLVLKGAHTLIAEPGGQVAVLPFKTDALATAGTGDVLAGAISGLLAQGLEPFRAAAVGGYLHGLAGMLAGVRQGSTRSVIARDLLDHLGAAFKQVEAS